MQHFLSKNATLRKIYHKKQGKKNPPESGLSDIFEDFLDLFISDILFFCLRVYREEKHSVCIE